MTALATHEPLVDVAVGRPRSVGLATVLEHACVGALLLWWALPLTRATGGREPHVVSIGLVIMAVALTATRPWRRLRVRELLLAASLPVAALIVCAFSPIGWDGANDLGSWCFAAGCYLVARAYLTGGRRVLAALGALALAGLAQFASSWLAWWGGADPSQPMIGTFYWHNQYAAFLLVPAVVGIALSVWPRRPAALIGWFAAPLCSAGVLFSTSRASIGLLGVGWLAALCLALWLPGRKKAVARLVLVAAVTVVTAFVLTGPPFFAHRASPSSAVAARSEKQSAAGDASYRTITWRQGLDVYREYPATGTGFHGFASAAVAADPHHPHSAYVHDAWLQAFSDGGTVLGVPFLLASLAALAGVLHALVTRIRRRVDPLGVMAGVGGMLLAAHSLVDFDTSYPALFAALAFAIALALASPVAGEVRPAGEPWPPARRRVGAGAVGLVVALALVAVVPTWHGAMQLNMDVPGAAAVPGGAH